MRCSARTGACSTELSAASGSRRAAAAAALALLAGPALARADAGTVTSGPARFSHSSYATFTFTAPAGTVATECAVDDRPFGACQGQFSTGYLLDGRHYFHLRTIDDLGQATTADTVFTIDTLAPTVTLGGTRASVSSAGTVSYNVYCPLSEPGGCTGSIRVGTVPDRKTHRYRRIATQSWTAVTNQTLAVAVTIPSWAVTKALRGGGLADRVVLTASDNAGNVTEIRRAGVLMAAAGAV